MAGCQFRAPAVVLSGRAYPAEIGPALHGTLTASLMLLLTMTAHDLELDDTVAGEESRPARRVAAHSRLSDDRRGSAVAMAVVLLFTAILSLTANFRGPGLSLYDEGTHADYAWQVAHGHFPAAGSLLAPEIREEFSCHGSAVGAKLPPCGAQNPPASKYPAGGQNYNWGHPPLYYAITGVLARAIDAVVPGAHFITAARCVGVLWLWAGLIAMFFALRKFRVPWQYAVVGAATLGLCPGIIGASAAVTNDAPAALGGALALWVLARVLVEKNYGIVLPTVLTVLITATKVMSAISMIGVAGVCLVMAFLKWRARAIEEARRLAVLGVSMLAGVFVVYKGWAIIQSHRGVAHWHNPIETVSGRPIKGVPFDELLRPLFNGSNLALSYFFSAPINGDSVTYWARLLNVLFFAAPLLALAVFPRGHLGWTLGAMTLGSLIVYPLVVEVQIYTTSDLYFPVVAPRYGMALIPEVIACLVLVAWHRTTLRMPVIGLCIGGLLLLLTEAAVL
ncbi:MAG TPA: hypothetical protein VGL21_00975 [Jatrophihabitantaceae bacterium]